MKTTALLIAILIPSGMAWAADAKAGGAAYEKSCKSCHGAAGVANPAIAKMMKVEMNDLSSPAVQSQTDAALKAVITGGKGKMKAIAGLTASPDDVVAFLRTLKK
jgi:mono/diheme cytochrome c family protein